MVGKLVDTWAAFHSPAGDTALNHTPLKQPWNHAGKTTMTPVHRPAAG